MILGANKSIDLFRWLSGVKEREKERVVELLYP